MCCPIPMPLRGGHAHSGRMTPPIQVHYQAQTSTPKSDKRPQTSDNSSPSNSAVDMSPVCPTITGKMSPNLSSCQTSDFFAPSDFSSPVPSSNASSVGKRGARSVRQINNICPHCKSEFNSDCRDGFCASIWNKENMMIGLRPIHIWRTCKQMYNLWFWYIDNLKNTNSALLWFWY